jgi:hypothetical protein
LVSIKNPTVAMPPVGFQNSLALPKPNRRAAQEQPQQFKSQFQFRHVFMLTGKPPEVNLNEHERARCSGFFFPLIFCSFKKTSS